MHPAPLFLFRLQICHWSRKSGRCGWFGCNMDDIIFVYLKFKNILENSWLIFKQNDAHSWLIACFSSFIERRHLLFWWLIHSHKKNIEDEIRSHHSSFLFIVVTFYLGLACVYGRRQLLFSIWLVNMGKKTIFWIKRAKKAKRNLIHSIQDGGHGHDVYS